MNLKSLLFLLVFISSANAQQIIGTIKDSSTNQILPLANITFLKGNAGTNSNLEGEYQLNLKGHSTDSIKISYVGYKSQYLSLNKFTENKDYELNFRLVDDQNQLNEVLVEARNVKYNRERTFSEERSGNIAIFTPIGHEMAFHIENPKNEIGRIKSVKLYVRKNKTADFIAKFRIKVYAFDKTTNKPGNNILTEDVIIAPKNKTYQYVINLEKFKISFPEDGVCVGFEMIDENSLSKKTDKIGPGLRFTNGDSKQRTFFNYRNKGWFKSNTRSAKKNTASNLMISLIVLMRE